MDYEKMWTTFGATTTAGRLLRQIYSPASHVRASNMISYPALKMKVPSSHESKSPIFRKATVAVPKFKKTTHESEQRHGGKRSSRVIFAQMLAQDGTQELPRMVVVDRDLEIRRLQERFQFSLVTCLPHAPKTNALILSEFAKPAPRLGELDQLLQAVIEQVKDDQTTLETMEDGMETRGTTHPQQKREEERRREQLILKKKIAEGMRDIKAIIECGN